MWLTVFSWFSIRNCKTNSKARKLAVNLNFLTNKEQRDALNAFKSELKMGDATNIFTERNLSSHGIKWVKST